MIFNTIPPLWLFLSPQNVQNLPPQSQATFLQDVALNFPASLLGNLPVSPPGLTMEAERSLAKKSRSQVGDRRGIFLFSFALYQQLSHLRSANSLTQIQTWKWERPNMWENGNYKDHTLSCPSQFTWDLQQACKKIYFNLSLHFKS